MLQVAGIEAVLKNRGPRNNERRRFMILIQYVHVREISVLIMRKLAHAAAMCPYFLSPEQAKNH